MDGDAGARRADARRLAVGVEASDFLEVEWASFGQGSTEPKRIWPHPGRLPVPCASAHSRQRTQFSPMTKDLLRRSTQNHLPVQCAKTRHYRVRSHPGESGQRVMTIRPVTLQAGLVNREDG
jgi:hypothetical protein